MYDYGNESESTGTSMSGTSILIGQCVSTSDETHPGSVPYGAEPLFFSLTGYINGEQGMHDT